MKLKTGILLLFSAFLTVGCYAEMTGLVVDAETGAPIEVAVVLVEWTVNKGIPGLPVTEVYEVQELVSDKDGKVKLSGVFNPSVDPPRVIVYKAGYVAWNNEFIFPGFKKRKDFEWGGHYIFKLDKFQKEYSHWDHISFVDYFLGGIPPEKMSLLSTAIAEEGKKGFQELRQKKIERK